MQTVMQCDDKYSWYFKVYFTLISFVLSFIDVKNNLAKIFKFLHPVSPVFKQILINFITISYHKLRLLLNLMFDIAVIYQMLLQT